MALRKPSDPEIELGRSKKLFALSKVHMAAMISVLTRHCTIGTHAVILKTLTNTICQSCNEKGELETSRHFLLNSPVFVRLMLKHLDCHTFYEAANRY